MPIEPVLASPLLCHLTHRFCLESSYRWSVFIVGGLISGAAEEAAFRGYMQTGLEQHDPDKTILITSLVFVAAYRLCLSGTHEFF